MVPCGFGVARRGGGVGCSLDCGRRPLGVVFLCLWALFGRCFGSGLVSGCSAAGHGQRLCSLRLYEQSSLIGRSLSSVVCLVAAAPSLLLGRLAGVRSREVLAFTGGVLLVSSSYFVLGRLCRLLVDLDDIVVPDTRASVLGALPLALLMRTEHAQPSFATPSLG